VQVVGQADPSTLAEAAGAVPARKYYGNRNHVGQAAGFGPYMQLKTKLLNTKGDLMLLCDDISSVFLLPRPFAEEAVRQIRRIYRGRRTWDISNRLDEFQVWKIEYSRLLRQIYSDELKEAPYHSTDWAKFTGQAEPSVSAMAGSWAALDQDTRERLWFRMIISILDTNPALVPSFVRATYDESWSQAYVVEDLIRLLLLRATHYKDTKAQDSAVDLFFFLLDSNSQNSLKFREDVIGTIVTLAPLEKNLALFDRLRAADESLQPATLLHFASVFAKSREHKSVAAQILCSLAKTKEYKINTPAVSSVCTSLLHLEEGGEMPDGPAAPDKLFEMLLQHGLHPNIYNITALMRNFCVRGYVDTAWTVFDLLLQYHIQPDQHVYSTLLNASKKELDAESIRRIMAAVSSHNAWNVVILNDLLDAIARDNHTYQERRRRQRKSNSAFRPMMQVYAKFFKLEPLQRLCTFPLEDYLLWQGPKPGHSSEITEIGAALVSQTEASLMDPDSTTLTMMLSAAIQGAPRLYPRAGKHKQERAITRLLSQLNHFRRLLRSKDPLAVEMVQKHGTLVFDIFLRGMLQFRQCLQPAVQLVRDMLRNAAEEEQQFGRTVQHPRPSVHTWTILVNGFKNHRQPGVAASMVKMMVKDGGIKPNMITWNTLVTAFARVSDARGAVRSVRYMEKSGLSPDKDTVQALGSMNPEARKLAVRLLEVSKNDPLPQDEVGVLLAAPQRADAAYPDPVVSQQKNKEAPPLSREQFEAEVQRLAEEGEALLSEETKIHLEQYNEQDFPATTSADSTDSSIAALHPLNTDPLRLLLKYKTDVEDFLARVREQMEPKDKNDASSAFNSTLPISHPSKTPPLQGLRGKTLESIRGAWEDVHRARDALRTLDLSEQPIGFRVWGEEAVARSRVRDRKFPKQPPRFPKAPATGVPLGIAAAKGAAPHPRISGNRYVNLDISRERVEGESSG
jgi:pentatricopeptide repeat protein